LHRVDTRKQIRVELVAVAGDLVTCARSKNSCI